MFRKSNPISYKLRSVVDRHAVDLHLSALRKQTKLIFRSLMKRLRAAYKYKNAEITASKALREDSIRHEAAMWASRCSGYEEDVNEKFNEVMDALTPSKWKTYTRGAFDVRNYDTIANGNIEDCNRGITTAEDYVKRVENNAFSVSRGQTKDPSGFTEHEHRVYQARILHKNLTALLLQLKAQYTYIREKYRARLAKIIFAFIEKTKGTTAGFPSSTQAVFHAANYTMYDLVKIGIPAADVVGPWWPRLKHVKSPMEFVDWCDKTYGDLKIDGDVVVRYKNFASPDAASWLYAHGLDGSDGAMQGAIRLYYQQHKAAPSVEWARRRQNELEEERKHQEMSRKIKPVTEFLKASARALKECSIGVPPLFKDWRIVKPDDAKELCERAQRDGLCVVDVISRLATNSDSLSEWQDMANQEGVCTLLFSTDPDCRTIVGLDADGKCTSEHHCAGRNNEVDEEAWERFK